MQFEYKSKMGPHDFGTLEHNGRVLSALLCRSYRQDRDGVTVNVAAVEEARKLGVEVLFLQNRPAQFRKICPLDEFDAMAKNKEILSSSTGDKFIVINPNDFDLEIIDGDDDYGVFND